MEFYENTNGVTSGSCLFDSGDDCDSKCDNCDNCDSCDYDPSCHIDYDDEPSCDTLTGGCSCDYDGRDSCHRD